MQVFRSIGMGYLALLRRISKTDRARGRIALADVCLRGPCPGRRSLVIAPSQEWSETRQRTARSQEIRLAALTQFLNLENFGEHTTKRFLSPTPVQIVYLPAIIRFVEFIH